MIGSACCGQPGATGRVIACIACAKPHGSNKIVELKFIVFSFKSIKTILGHHYGALGIRIQLSHGFHQAAKLSFFRIWICHVPASPESVLERSSFLDDKTTKRCCSEAPLVNAA